MPRPSISIVIEWENARFAELQRSRRMLRALREELSGFGPAKAAPEVYIVFDRFTIDAAVVEQVVREEFDPATAPTAMKIMPTDGLHYYEQKNLGASQGESEIIVFLDCDVVPEHGWLGEMIAAFDDPAVSVVGGETYVELVDGWSRAFALFWLFDIRRERTGLVPSKFFHANNVAFRRSTFAQFHYRELPLYRGQCIILGADLLSHGIGIFRQRGARASHPYPIGLSYFTARALHNGRDIVCVARIQSDVGTIGLVGAALGAFARNIARTGQRLFLHRKHLGLTPLLALGACVLALVYFVLRLGGEILTIARPHAIRKAFPI
ncbi:MAG TPA: glycosyltransferase [Rhizomicrobium sp.]|nr:glycosyltransferase [Rhizomicrobium sp.]